MENIQPTKSIHNIQLIKLIQHLTNVQAQQVVQGFGAIFTEDEENTGKYNKFLN